MASGSNSGMFLHGEPTCELRDGSAILLVGNLSKKSTWIGKWRVRRFELYKDRTLKHYKLSSGQHLGTVSLKAGSYVRQVVDAGYGRKFQLITADGKVYNLHAPNVETRDTWCHHLQRAINSAIYPSATWGLNGWGALPNSLKEQPTATAGDSSSSSSSGSGNSSDSGSSPESDSIALASTVVDVAIPQGCDVKNGCALSVLLIDGRTVHVTVPPQTPPGALVRAQLSPLGVEEGANAKGHVGGSSAAAAAAAAASRPSLALDACSPHCVAILVPCAPLITAKWSQGFGASSRSTSTSSSSSSSSASEDPPLPQPPYLAEAATAADLTPPKTAKFASELPPHLADKFEVDDDETSTALITSKYNMKMLSALGKMETDFRNDLAAIWGVEDEEALPEELQALDFHDILMSGDTEAVRTCWLLSKLTESPGYLPTKMKRTVAGMTEKTIQMIQELERQYAS